MHDFLSGPAGSAAFRILKKLREHGYEAYFAGGCVRDYLLGQIPQDYDIATSARVKEVLALFPESIMVGAGPRATQSLILAARANAAISGRDFVTPDDIKEMAIPVLGHRLILRPDYEIEGATAAEVIRSLLQEVAVPR